MNQPQQPRKLKVGKGAGAGFVLLSTLAAVTFIGTREDGAKPILTVYADQFAEGLPTGCYGLTKHVTTAPIVVGETWTLEHCHRVFSEALIKVQEQLGKCFERKPPQSVFDAATSHAWNLGAGRTCGSAAMKAWNRGEWELGCRRLQFADDGRPVWSYAGGKFVRGLANRRALERNVCVKFDEYDPHDPESIN